MVDPGNHDTNTKQEPSQEEDGDDEEGEEQEEEETKEETPTYNEILTPAQLAQRQMIQDSLQMFQSSLAMRGQAEVKYFLCFSRTGFNENYFRLT